MFKRLLIVALFIPFLSGCLAAVATTAIVGSDMAADRRTSGAYVDDQSIELRALRYLGRNIELKESSSINVISYNRIVLLVGQTPNNQLKNEAAEIIRNLDGVRKVHNELRISAPDSILSATSDTWITTKAKSLLLAEKNFASSHIKVISENGELFLMGIVNRVEAEKAIAIVRDIDGVERVINVFEIIR